MASFALVDRTETDTTKGNNNNDNNRHHHQHHKYGPLCGDLKLDGQRLDE